MCFYYHWWRLILWQSLDYQEEISTYKAIEKLQVKLCHRFSISLMQTRVKLHEVALTFVFLPFFLSYIFPIWSVCWQSTSSLLISILEYITKIVGTRNTFSSDVRETTRLECSSTIFQTYHSNVWKYDSLQLKSLLKIYLIFSSHCSDLIAIQITNV